MLQRVEGESERESGGCGVSKRTKLFSLPSFVQNTIPICPLARSPEYLAYSHLIVFWAENEIEIEMYLPLKMMALQRWQVVSQSAPELVQAEDLTFRNGAS